ncbi:hypothetical protein [Sphingomonas koreensis]
MGTKCTMRRAILAASVGFAVAGLLWWLADRDARPGEDAGVVVQAAAGPAAPRAMPLAMIGAGAPAPAEMEKQILAAIGEPGTRIRDVRIVDQKRQIACGERIDQSAATPRRFVWLSQLRQIVTDDGGQDFAILIHVCTPPPSS